MIVQLILMLMMGWGLNTSDLPVSVYEVKLPDGSIEIRSQNKEFRPYTLEINWSVRNVATPPAKFFVVPALAKDYALTVIKPTAKAYSYSYHFTCIPGDIVGTKHNDSYTYAIPFKPGFKSKVSQGYNGSYSHNGIKAIDFVAPQGTPVCAAREGIVVEVVQHNKSGCASSKCMRLANFVKILHDDGSEALYSHLQYRGSLVSPGEKVTRGQVIAKSGNTGWTTNPHLHFEVLIPDYKGGKSIPTKFKMGNQMLSLNKGDEIDQSR